MSAEQQRVSAEQQRVIAEQQRVLTDAINASLAEKSTPALSFSAASTSAVRNLATARGIHQEHRELSEQTLGRFLPHEGFFCGDFAPWTWAVGTTETSQSSALMVRLDAWVKASKRLNIACSFVDVQGFSAHCPLVIEEEGVGVFRGVPDWVALAAGNDDAPAPFVDCMLTVDFKTTDAMASSRHSAISAIACLQAIALSQWRDDGCSVPVFFTDMSTSFRCWMLFDGKLLAFHPSRGSLDLRHGVALMRYFLAHKGQLDIADAARFRALPVGGGGRARSASASAESGKASGRAALEKRGKASGRAAVSHPGGAATGSGTGPTEPVDSSKSSPDDPKSVASYRTSVACDVAYFEEAMIAAARDLKQMGGFDLRGVLDYVGYDPS